MRATAAAAKKAWTTTIHPAEDPGIRVGRYWAKREIVGNRTKKYPCWRAEIPVAYRAQAVGARGPLSWTGSGKSLGRGCVGVEAKRVHVHGGGEGGMRACFASETTLACFHVQF